MGGFNHSPHVSAGTQAIPEGDLPSLHQSSDDLYGIPTWRTSSRRLRLCHLDESEANKDLSPQSKRRQTENIIKMLTERRLLFSPPETESLATYLLHIHALFPMAEMFIFTLFSDPEKDPPQLNYTEMLLYFASNPDAIEGVYQALSVATGTQIKRKKDKFSTIPRLFTPSAERLIASDAHDDLVEEEAGEETEDEDEDKEKEDEAESFTNEGNISLATLLRVFRHETNKAADNHRFSGYLTAEDNYEHFIKVYKDLGSEALEPIPVALLLKHPFMQDLINNYQGYKLHTIYGTDGTLPWVRVSHLAGLSKWSALMVVLKGFK
nr:sperm flagellar protein 2-like [Pogona vitticeps]